MLKLLTLLLICMIDFIMINQFIFPALSCGSTTGESISFLGLILLGMVNYIIIKKLFKTKK